MKQIIKFTTFFLIVLFILVSCKKDIKPTVQEFQNASVAVYNRGQLKQTKNYSSEVVLKWMDLQYHILLLPQEQTTSSGFFPSRYYAYCGIALYESVVPGMPDYQSLSGQLSEMPAMPETQPGMAYHWPSSANAAMASFVKNSFPNTSAANKASIDSLENALNTIYQLGENSSTFQRSVEFGKAVAQIIFDWSKTDDFFTVYPPYVLPVGPGLWQLTPPDFSLPGMRAYRGNLRPLMPGVLNANIPQVPTAYSTNPSSVFFKTMKQVYDSSLTLTSAQMTQARYWRGTIGGSTVAHWFTILRKILFEQGSAAMLDKVALSYCKMGIAQGDANIAGFKTSFLYNQVRPITYIRNVMGYTTWNTIFPTFPTPGYPEPPILTHSSCGATLSLLFGDNYQFNTDGTQDMGLPGYSFNSFNEAIIHASLSRFYAGICTKPSIDAGIWIGQKTVEYMDHNVMFLK